MRGYPSAWASSLSTTMRDGSPKWVLPPASLRRGAHEEQIDRSLILWISLVCGFCIAWHFTALGSRNSLDHANDPLMGILQLIWVVRSAAQITETVGLKNDWQLLGPWKMLIHIDPFCDSTLQCKIRLTPYYYPSTIINSVSCRKRPLQAIKMIRFHTFVIYIFLIFVF